MNTLLFPGQGSQFVGMGFELYNKFDTVKKIFKEADEKLNFSLTELIIHGPEDKLKLTENTQPAILTVSFSIFKILKEEFNINFNNFKYFAGHSLGEYTALVCSGALDFKDAIYLLNERGKAMQAAVPVGKGSMIAVLGTEINDIQNLIMTSKNNNGICEIANDNADGQIILSGSKERIESFQLELKDKKIKSIPLKVSAPFHCSLMKPAAENMKTKINNIEFKKPEFDIINNVIAKPVRDPQLIKKLLVEQIFSTVKWRESIVYMSKNNVKNYIEIGPGKVLTGMVKRTLKDVNCFSINEITDMKNLKNELQR